MQFQGGGKECEPECLREEAVCARWALSGARGGAGAGFITRGESGCGGRRGRRGKPDRGQETRLTDLRPAPPVGLLGPPPFPHLRDTPLFVAAVCHCYHFIDGETESPWDSAKLAFEAGVTAKLSCFSLRLGVFSEEASGAALGTRSALGTSGTLVPALHSRTPRASDARLALRPSSAVCNAPDP